MKKMLSISFLSLTLALVGCGGKDSISDTEDFTSISALVSAEQVIDSISKSESVNKLDLSAEKIIDPSIIRDVVETLDAKPDCRASKVLWAAGDCRRDSLRRTYVFSGSVVSCNDGSSRTVYLRNYNRFVVEKLCGEWIFTD